MVRDTQIYETVDGKPVSLAIDIGDAQAGGTSIIWRTEIVDIPPNPQPHVLNPDRRSIRTQILHVTTRVRDVNQSTNRTSVTYVLRGGAREEKFAYRVEVPTHGEFAEYVVDFVFI